MRNDTIFNELLADDYRLGEFEILRRLHSGGQAHVYLARRERPGQISRVRLLRQLDCARRNDAEVGAMGLVAIKVARPSWEHYLRDEHDYLTRRNTNHERLVQLASSEGGAQRTRGEHGLNFVMINDSEGHTIRLPYIVLCYYPGGTLKELLDRHRTSPLPAATAVAIGCQIAAGLHHLHEKSGLVHLDISPSNILLRSPLSPFWPSVPECVIADLAAADSPTQPRQQQRLGKRAYLAPERVSRRSPEVTPAVDVYALGVVLYEMLSGRQSSSSSVTSDPVQRFAPIQERRAGLSAALSTLVMAMVHPNPQRRPSIVEVEVRLRDTPESKQSAAIRGPLGGGDWQMGLIAGTVSLIAAIAFGLGAIVARPPELPVPTLTPVPSVTPLTRPTSTTARTPPAPTSTLAVPTPRATP